MSVDKIDRILTIVKSTGYVLNLIAMLVLIIIEITMKANPICIAVLAFLFGAYTMLVLILLFSKYLWKSGD